MRIRTVDGPKWECMACGATFAHLDNSDLPQPRLTAPITDPDFMERWSNRSVVTKKNLTTPLITDIVENVLDTQR